MMVSHVFHLHGQKCSNLQNVAVIYFFRVTNIKLSPLDYFCDKLINVQIDKSR